MQYPEPEDSKQVAKWMHHILLEAFDPTYIEIIDKSALHAKHIAAHNSGIGHYQLIIGSKKFHNHSLLSIHRMIYQALEDIKIYIHALSIKVKHD